ncbi:MAG: DNA topoisomerase I [Candidatus Aenigmarchaeota archaeon]|nr:DNA topoisomerase I [Candidatus Aenigmarchaeota archaeon]
MKWKSFKHNGVYFPPEYEWKKLSVKISGEKVQLNKEQEEMLYAWAKKINTPYVKDPVFQKNFLSDFKKLMSTKYSGIIMDDIDLSEIVKYQENEKDLTKEEKKVLAEKMKRVREELKEKYGYVEIDGNKSEIANWMVEPPGIFLGRGEHPLRGRWKPRIYPADITLNLSKDAPIPAGDWKKILHGNDFMWIASWRETLTDKVKHVWPSEGSQLRQKREKEKYDKAISIDEKLDVIRKHVSKGMMSKDEKTRKVATVCYLIDRLVMRVGDEKDEDEADTVGASTLRVEHVKFNPDSIKFDFLGKDSVKWQKKISLAEADPSFVKNMNDFTKNKKESSLVFDGVNSRIVNQFFGSAVKGLTAKVFRTYHATKTLISYLKDVHVNPKDGQFSKLYQAKMANLEVAVTCNHKKTPPKSWEETQARKQEKLTKWMNTTPKTEKQAEKLKERIEKLKMDIDMSKKTKEYNLNTSLKNYIDPRVYKAWLDKMGIDWTKLYTSSLQKKFSWISRSKLDWKKVSDSK